MLLKITDLEELIAKYPEINDLDFSNLSPEELIKHLYEKLNKKLLPKNLDKNFLNYLNLELKAKNKKLLLEYLRYFILISKLTSKENTGYLNTIKQITEFQKFQKESADRIKKLKKELSKKYPVYNDLIGFKFDNFLKELEREFNPFSDIVDKVNEIKIDNKTISNFYGAKKGRPKDMLLDVFLEDINKLAEELYPANKFEKIITPFFTFIAKNFPDILDMNDVSTEQLRQKIKRSNSNKKKKSGN